MILTEVVVRPGRPRFLSIRRARGRYKSIQYALETQTGLYERCEKRLHHRHSTIDFIARVSGYDEGVGGKALMQLAIYNPLTPKRNLVGLRPFWRKAHSSTDQLIA